ncbi:putative angiotensin-converting enzyme 2 [Lupinus albus]|uniref:Putative angiotensin-converting enzyme 2 n=1 Tax=Lupinus albus TaxID=3870 RepID=A0A6A4PA40_LUPAL|nr:putative angiotensin-converting enzyme 2 [Lupinus albus]
MKNLQNTEELQSSTQASNEPKCEQPNNHTTDAPVTDSGSASASSNDSKKVSRQDIELVQNLIERCLQLYMNKDEVVKTLLTRAKIDPGFTTLVAAMNSSRWRQLQFLIAPRRNRSFSTPAAATESCNRSNPLSLYVFA